jgi:hypothetical protein
MNEKEDDKHHNVLIELNRIELNKLGMKDGYEHQHQNRLYLCSDNRQHNQTSPDKVSANCNVT